MVNNLFNSLQSQQSYLEEKELYCVQDFCSPFNLLIEEILLVQRKWSLSIPMLNLFDQLGDCLLDRLERKEDE